MDIVESVNDYPHVKLQETNSAFGRRMHEFDLVNNGFKDIEEFLLNAFELYRAQIINAIAQFDLIKTLSYFIAEFERSFQNDDQQSEPLHEKRMIYIPSIIKEIDSSSDLNEHFENDVINHIKKKVDEVMVEGSGFTLGRIEKLSVQIFKYEPLRGSGDIELPKQLKNKRAIINLKNTYEECFKWTILAALHHDEVREINKNKVNDAACYKRWAHELNFNGIDFPVRLNQIEKFMQQNEDIAVNVYYFDLEKQRVCPLFLAKKPPEKRYIHLLLLTEEKSGYFKKPSDVNVRSHYCWIKNFSALVHTQITKNTRKIIICDRCLNHFCSNDQLKKHRTACITSNECAIEMPEIGKNFETFKNYKNELKTPFIIYADTESLLKKPEKPIFNVDCSTQAHQQHEVHSIGYYVKSESNELKSNYASHRGPRCIEWFMNELTNIANKVYDIFEEKKAMRSLTEGEDKMFKETPICHICKKAFNQSDVRVKDHCHMTGLYRGAAHQSCNLQYQISRTIPVVMHNLSGYDSHLLIRKLSNEQQIPGEITIIPQNSENYISFIKTMKGVGASSQYTKEGVGATTQYTNYKHVIKFKFIDSLRFMSASLEYLASLIPPEKKTILKSECIKSGYCSDEEFTLLIRKGVFPYEYVDKYEKLEEIMLPSKESFFSMLTESNVSEEDYKHAQNVWCKFAIRSLGEYSDLYLKTDVLLLADVFENFRNTCHAAYSLDPAQYFSAPGLSFDAMLKYTGVSIELFTDVDMLMFAERGIRGGVSQINKRYVKANNMYMNEEFNLSKETSYLLYMDGKYSQFRLFYLP